MKRTWLVGGIFLLVLASVGGFYALHAVLPNVAHMEDEAFFVSDQWSSEQLLHEIIDQGVLKHDLLAAQWAEIMSFHASTVKPGRYFFDTDMTTYDVLNRLRRGEQHPLQVKIEGVQDIPSLAGHLGATLMHDSLHYVEYLMTYASDTFLCTIVPNSYELYWTTDASAFMQRMEKECARYWQDDLGSVLGWPMRPCEIVTLASIVERESQYQPERPTIAGVYMNRLKRGIPLQADPTVIYSLNDPTIRRVLYKHLAAPSPYNTYLHPGLPPGPICMPSLQSIEAVRNAEDHDYLYFCAKADNSGTHAFAETLRQHNKNARAFQRWLNQRGIR